MAALLAVHIRGIEVIENIVGFHGFCASLGIPSDSIPLVLSTLESTGWVRVSPNVYNAKRIEESVPYFSELYNTLGQQWIARIPSEVEQATMAIIEQLSEGPQAAGAVAEELSLEASTFQTVVEIGELGGYLRRYQSPRDKIEILYAPLFVDENPEALLNFLARRSSDHERIKGIMSYAKGLPGMPISELERADPLVIELVNSNVIAAPAVVSSGGAHSFAFAPFRTNQPRSILEKARIILACVRYGEKFSTITRIGSDERILRSLRTHKMIGRTPHSNIGTQYAPAVNFGVGFLERVGTRYRFRLYDTPDNVAAVDLAIAMCSGATEDEVHRLMPEREVRSRLAAQSPIGLVLPESNRGNALKAIAKRRLDPKTQTAARLGAQLLDDLRGVHRVIR